MFSKSSVSSLVIKEVLNCFSKVKSWRVSVSLIIVGFWNWLPEFKCFWLFALKFSLYRLLHHFSVLNFLLVWVQMLNLPEAQKDKSVLSDLLQSFQPIEIPASVISDIQPIPLPGTIDYLYLGAFSFLEGVLNIGMRFSQVSMRFSQVSIYSHHSIVSALNL